MVAMPAVNRVSDRRARKQVADRLAREPGISGNSVGGKSTPEHRIRAS